MRPAVLVLLLSSIVVTLNAPLHAQRSNVDAFLKRAVSEWRKATTPDPEVKAAYLNELTRVYLQANHFDDAIHTARQLDEEERIEWLGDIAVSIGENTARWQQAIEIVYEIEDSYDRDEVLGELATTAIGADRIDLSRMAVSKISDSYQLSEIGKTLARYGKTQDAEALLERLDEDDEKIELLLALSEATAEEANVGATSSYQQARVIFSDSADDEPSMRSLFYFQGRHGLVEDLQLDLQKVRRNRQAAIITLAESIAYSDISLVRKLWQSLPDGVRDIFAKEITGTIRDPVVALEFISGIGDQDLQRYSRQRVVERLLRERRLVNAMNLIATVPHLDQQMFLDDIAICHAHTGAFHVAIEEACRIADAHTRASTLVSVARIGVRAKQRAMVQSICEKLDKIAPTLESDDHLDLLRASGQLRYQVEDHNGVLDSMRLFERILEASNEQKVANYAYYALCEFSAALGNWRRAIDFARKIQGSEQKGFPPYHGQPLISSQDALGNALAVSREIRTNPIAVRDILNAIPDPGKQCSVLSVVIFSLVEDKDVRAAIQLVETLPEGPLRAIGWLELASNIPAAAAEDRTSKSAAMLTAPTKSRCGPLRRIFQQLRK